MCSLSGEKERRAERELQEENTHQRVPQGRQDTDALYPDTYDLLQLAENMSATRGQVSDTAEDMLDSANQVREGRCESIHLVDMRVFFFWSNTNRCHSTLASMLPNW